LSNNQPTFTPLSPIGISINHKPDHIFKQQNGIRPVSIPTSEASLTKNPFNLTPRYELLTYKEPLSSPTMHNLPIFHSQSQSSLKATNSTPSSYTSNQAHPSQRTTGFSSSSNLKHKLTTELPSLQQHTQPSTSNNPFGLRKTTIAAKQCIGVNLMTKFGSPNGPIELPTSPDSPVVLTNSSNTVPNDETHDFDEDDGYQAYTDSSSSDESSECSSGTDDDYNVEEESPDFGNRRSQFTGITIAYKILN
jgi:hypothetical protein